MKKVFLLGLLSLLFVSCNEGETIEETDENKQESEEAKQETDAFPLMNMYGEDSLDAEGNLVYPSQDELQKVDTEVEQEDLGYTLGPIPENALLNMYGEDSLDAEGNLVFPARDTIFDE